MSISLFPLPYRYLLYILPCRTGNQQSQCSCNCSINTFVITWLIESSFCSESSRHWLSQTVGAGGSWNFQRIFTPHHVSQVRCQVSGVKRNFFFTNWWSYSGEGLLSTGRTPSSLLFSQEFKTHSQLYPCICRVASVCSTLGVQRLLGCPAWPRLAGMPTTAGASFSREIIWHAVCSVYDSFSINKKNKVKIYLF